MICDNGFYREKLIDPRTGKRSLHDTLTSVFVGVRKYMETHIQHGERECLEYLYYRKRMHDFYLFEMSAPKDGKTIKRPYFKPISDEEATAWANKYGFEQELGEARDGMYFKTKIKVCYEIPVEVKEILRQETARTGLSEVQIVCNAIRKFCGE